MRLRPIIAHCLVPCLALLIGGCTYRRSSDVQYKSIESAPKAMRAGGDGSQSLAKTGDSAPASRDLGKGAEEEKLPPPERRAPSAAREDGFSTATDSTFAIDVDDASWIGLRRALRNRAEPDPNLIRVEECVNAFAYHYAPPPEKDALTADASLVRCPWSPKHQLLRIGIQAKEVADGLRPATNLVLLVDTSGSMNLSQRLPLLQRAFHRLAARLDARDRLAIVAYAGNARVVLEPTAGDDQARIGKAIDGMSASGGTNGDAGIRTAYELARRQFIQGGQNRVLLATDGDFNLGVTDNRELVRLVRDEARGGVLLNVLGVGDSAEGDRRMEAIADRGDGVYTALEDDRDVERLLAGPLGSQLTTVARDAKVQLWMNPEAVAGWRLVGYRDRLLQRADFNDDDVDGGEIGAGHQVTALYEIAPRDDRNPFIDTAVLCRLRLRWQRPEGGSSVLREVDIRAQEGSVDRDTGWAAGIAAIAMKAAHDPAMIGWSWASLLEMAGPYADDAERSEALRLLRRLEN